MGMSNLTLITLAWELYQQGVPKSRIAKRLGKNRETIHLWVKGVEAEGLLPFLERYQQAKKGPRTGRQVDPLVKRWVWELREREEQCCRQKIVYFLEREHGVHLSVPKVYEVLRERYVIRSKWKKNHLRGPVPHATAPRQVVQMDSILLGASTPSPASTSTPGKQISWSHLRSPLPMVVLSWIGPWRGGLVATWRSSRPMAAVSSRMPS